MFRRLLEKSYRTVTVRKGGGYRRDSDGKKNPKRGRRWEGMSSLGFLLFFFKHKTGLTNVHKINQGQVASINNANIFLPFHHSSQPEPSEDSSRSVKDNKAEEVTTSAPLQSKVENKIPRRHRLVRLTRTQRPYSANKHTCTNLCTLCAPPPPSLMSRPVGGLHKNRSFVTHDVPGQGIHYR